MSSYVFDQIKPLVSEGNINFVQSGLFYIALVDETAFADFTTGALSDFAEWSDISANHEIINNPALNSVGYQILPLNNVSSTDVDVNGFTQTLIEADDIIYQASKIDAYGAVVFMNDNGGVDGGGQPIYNGTLVTALDFGGRVSSNNGIYTISLSGGFLRIK